MLRGLLNQEARELKQRDTDAIRGTEWIVRIDDFADEHRDNVLRVVLVRHGRTTDQFRTFTSLETHRETGDYD